MGIRSRIRDLVETVAGLALMVIAFGPMATAAIVFEAYKGELHCE